MLQSLIAVLDAYQVFIYIGLWTLLFAAMYDLSSS